MTLALGVVGDAAGFGELAGEWDELVLARPRPSPYLLHAWLLPWIETFGETGRVAVHVARRDGRLVAALPLIVDSRAGLRVGRFLGRGQSALADLLVAAGEGDEAPRALIARATDGVDLLDVFGLPADSALGRHAGGRLRLLERVEAPVLDLSRGWETVYAEKTGSKKRNLHRRRRRQLDELGGLTVEHASTLDALEPALEEAFRLHRLRWAGRPDGSGFASERGERFQRAALRGIAPAGVPRIVTVRIGGRAVAFHYYFLLAGTMLVHRLAFDPALGRYSPGLVATLEALEAAAADGATRVEYLGGDERYKLELSDGLEPLHQGLGLAGSPQGAAIALARLGAIRSRRRLKRSETLRRAYVEGLAPLRRLRRRSTAS